MAQNKVDQKYRSRLILFLGCTGEASTESPGETGGDVAESGGGKLGVQQKADLGGLSLGQGVPSVAAIEVAVAVVEPQEDVVFAGVVVVAVLGTFDVVVEGEEGRVVVVDHGADPARLALAPQALVVVRVAEGAGEAGAAIADRDRPAVHRRAPLSASALCR